MVLPLELRTTQEGVIWPRRPLISARGLLSSVRNLPFSSHDKRPSRFRAVAFNAPGDILAAVDERGRVFAFFVAANRYALVQHLGVPALACCFNPARKTELLVTCENETVGIARDRGLDVEKAKNLRVLACLLSRLGALHRRAVPVADQHAARPPLPGALRVVPEVRQARADGVAGCRDPVGHQGLVPIPGAQCWPWR